MNHPARIRRATVSPGKALAAGALLLALAATGAAVAQPLDVTLTVTGEGDHAVLVMENAAWRLTIQPDLGGRVSHAVFKATGNDWAWQKGGLFLDHVTQQVWPGELLDAPYHYEVRANGPDTATVRLWRTIKGDGNVAISGVVFEKELSLERDDPRIHAILRLRNPTDVPRSPVPWSQHMIYVGASRDNDHYFRPSTTGVLEAWADFTATDTLRHGADFVREPTAGWTAIADSVTGEGAVFLMPYNDLFWLYNCVGGLTLEWWDDPVPLAPGASWETPVTVVPFLGLKSVAYADEQVIAALEPAYGAGKLAVDLSLVAAAPEGLQQVSGEIALVSHPGGQALKTEAFTADAVGAQPATRRFDLGPLLKSEQAVIRVKLQAGGHQAEFERYFDPMAAQKAQFGQVDTSYRVPKPKKDKQFTLAPEARVQHHARPRVLLCEGLHSSAWGLDEALRRLGPESVRVAHHTIFVYGDQLDYMPATPEELLQYDLIILSNIPAEALTDVGVAFLKLYVARGGGLLVLGGAAAYGAGSYGESDLQSILPVMVDGRFDRVELKGGAPLTAATKTGEALFGPLPQGPKVPRAYWVHKIAGLRTGSHVLLQAGDMPAVVLASYSAPKVAAVLLTPWGDPSPGSVGFWQWRGWPQRLAKLMEYLITEHGED